MFYIGLIILILPWLKLVSFLRGYITIVISYSVFGVVETVWDVYKEFDTVRGVTHNIY